MGLALLCVLPRVGFGAAGDLADARVLRLEDMDLSNMVQGYGQPMINQSIDKNPLTIGGVQFEHGVGTHAIGRFTIDLKGVALAFRAKVGLDDEASSKPGSVVFRVYVDKKKVYDSGVLKGRNAPREVNVDLRDAKRLDLIVNDAGDFIHYDHADWADAVLLIKKDASEIPVSVPRKTAPSEILTPKPSGVPRINAPGILGAGPNREFNYIIPIAGDRPLKVSVTGLPEGIVLNPAVSRLIGETGEPGEHTLTITAENAMGKDTRTVILKVGDGLAKTPPMGWNSWNCWGCSVDEDKIKAAADTMQRSGLFHHGWTYINIDDCWQGSRDPETGKITSNEKFPDMKALADHVHARGLKFGVYTDVGTKTCAGYEGSKGHEVADANTYAEWGVDYVKVDWCNTEGMEPEPAYEKFGDALENCGRDIVFSICNWGHKDPWEWGERVGGNLWRTTGDIVDTWGSVYQIAMAQAPLYPYAGPGHWNDPDMLVVGKVGWGPSLRDSRLGPNQQYSHISLWCLLSAPLILGCDLTQLDDFTMNLLTNDEVLAVNQDVLGKQARHMIKTDQFQVWVKDLADGTKAVGIFNIANNDLDDIEPAEFTLRWADIGLKGPQTARDLWRQKDLGVFPESYTAQIPEYGVLLIKVAPAAE